MQVKRTLYSKQFRQTVNCSHIIAPCLAVRTHGSTSILRLKSSGSPLENLGTLLRADIGNHEMMDMKLTGTPYEVITINERGSLHQTNFLNGSKSS